MSLSDRYTRIFLQSSPTNLAEARNRRLRLSAVRNHISTLRTAADFEPNPVDEPSSLVLISPEMRQQLKALGYDGADIKKMTPDTAQQLIGSGVSKQDQEAAAARREKLFDALDDKVLRDLEALKKRLELAKRRLEKAHQQVESLDSKLAEVEEAREKASTPEEQENLRRSSERIQAHIERAEKAESTIRRDIEAMNRLVSAITKTEDGLIDELQEAHDSAALTPGTEDDQIVEQLMAEKLKEMDAISELRKRFFAIQKSFDKKMERLLRTHKEIAQLAEVGGSRYEVNTLREVAVSLQEDVDRAEKEHRSILKEILRKEDSLRDIQTEQRLQELDEVLKDLPDAKSMEQLREKSKEQIQQEDLGREIASKPQAYRKKAEEMLSFVDGVSKRYGEFILSYLAQDIPSDPKVDQFITTTNAVILKRAQEAKALAAPYSRNPMHRSAIILVPSLYEFLATTMNAVVEPETKAAMALAQDAKELQSALVEAGMVKEALDLQQIMDTSRSVGQGLGDAARWTKDKAKQVGEGVSSLVERGKEALDRRKFQKTDTDPSRDPKARLQREQQALGRLIQLEADLQSQLAKARQLHEQFRAEGDQKKMNEALKVVTKLQNDLKSLGERKDILNKGLNHVPESGMMRSQEQAARAPKSDLENARALLEIDEPKLVSLIRAGIPNDRALETELLRQSNHVKTAVQLMIQQGLKAKDKYPNLPPTISAYGHMFLAIDEALYLALRPAKE